MAHARMHVFFSMERGGKGGKPLETSLELKIQFSCKGMFKACLAESHHNPVLAWLAPHFPSAHCSFP